jgi:hypothetical protein
MMATTIARTAPLALLGVAVLFFAMTSARVGSAPAPQVIAEQMPAPPAWRTALQTMDRALVAPDISAAEIAWHDAHGHAIRSRQWDALLAVGEGALRIGDHVVVREPYRARAREAWLGALLRARQQRALDGVLSVAEAFGSLRDTDVVAQALHIADGLAARDGDADAQGRVTVVRQRLLLGPTQGSSLPPWERRRGHA